MRYVVAFACLLFFVAAFSQGPPPSKWKAGQEPPSQPKNDTTKAAPAEPLISVATVQAMIDKEQAKNKKEQSLQEADTNTWIMRFTGCLVLVGVFQAWFMLKSLSLTRQTFEDVERAFIAIDSAEMLQHTRGVGSRIVKVAYKNGGKTIAKDVTFNIWWGIGQSASEARGNSSLIPHGVKFSLLPNIPMGRECLLAIDRETDSQIRLGKQRLYVWGTCQYISFNKTRATKFSVVLGLDGNFLMSDDPGGNDSD